MSYFLLTVVLLLFLFFILWFWIFKTSPLPANTDELIQKITTSELPELMPGKSGFAQNGKLKIAYEVLENENSKNGNVLLVNGHTQTLLMWQPYFHQLLLDAGYRVIRYDNRGFGMSDWIKNWGEKDAAGNYNNKYTLTEMATDGVAVLNHLGIEKAHIVGASMGGMIGQTMAINHPEKVLSLTSIMSTGFYDDKKLTGIPKPFLMNLVKLVLRNKSTMHLDATKMKYQLGLYYILKGKGDYKIDDYATLQQAYYDIKKRNGFNAKAADQHGYAIKKSGSRYEDLKKLNTPTLVVHGTDDTLILVEHAKKYAAMIPNAKLLLLDGMGHDIPEKYSPEIVEAMVELFESVGRLDVSR